MIATSKYRIAIEWEREEPTPRPGRRGCGAPAGAAPTGMSALDIILDITNGKVYRYITATTYVDMTATS